MSSRGATSQFCAILSLPTRPPPADLEVTLQGRLELTCVPQAVQVIHGALPISSRQPVSVQA
jgi:hypothetical protein